MERKRLGGRTRGVTLADVAGIAGVSEITVSRILRSKGPVAEETRQRVLAAVRSTGYVPNRLAGGLASSGSKLLAVIIPSLSNIVFPEVLRGVHTALENTGFEAVVGVSNYDMETEEKLVGSLLAWQPEAMIIAGFDHTDTARAMLEGSGVRIACATVSAIAPNGWKRSSTNTTGSSRPAPPATRRARAASPGRISSTR